MILKEAGHGASKPEQIFCMTLFPGEVKSTNIFHHPSLMFVGVEVFVCNIVQVLVLVRVYEDWAVFLVVALISFHCRVDQCGKGEERRHRCRTAGSKGAGAY